MSVTHLHFGGGRGLPDTPSEFVMRNWKISIFINRKLNKNFSKMGEIFAKMRSNILSKVYGNSQKFCTKLNETEKKISFIFANFVQRKFRWKPYLKHFPIQCIVSIIRIILYLITCSSARPCLWNKTLWKNSFLIK